MAQMHLSAALADRFQVPVTQVAQAVAGRNLRAGQGLDMARAQALAEQLAALGAMTEFRPSLAGRGPAQTGVARTVTTNGSHGTSKTELSLLGDASAGTPSQLHLPTLVAAGAARTAVGRQSAYDTGPLPLPHQLPSSSGLRIPTSLADAGPAGLGPTPTPTRDPFAPPDEGVTGRLELAPARASEEPRASQSVAGASGLTIARMGADTQPSGVPLGVDEGKSHLVRCAAHGLHYDQRTASGCRKCLAPAAARARSMVPAKRSLHEQPAKRAFVGLGLALGLGFVPALYNARVLGTHEVVALRAEQAGLSQKVGTEDTLRQFDDLEARVGEAQGRSMRNTLVLWVLVAGGAFAAFYRATAPRT